MPMVYQQNINSNTRLGVWHISETEDFFENIPFQRLISHPHKRLQHLAGRHLLRVLYPDFPFALIKIAETRKPYLADEQYHFSISHCGDFAAAVVSTQNRTGVDVEKITHRVQKVQHKFLSDKELQLLSELELEVYEDITELRHTLLTITWSIKEALYKWYGDGEVDFKAHLHIEKITWNGQNGTAICRVSRVQTIVLNVQFFIYQLHCISWVISPATH
jgi:phosphopantetheinyl transferase